MVARTNENLKGVKFAMRRRENSKQQPRGNSTGKGIGAGGARICEKKRVKIES